MTCREWLLENNYADVAALIDRAMAKIEAKGKKSRRNWWDTLAGGPGGHTFCTRGDRISRLASGADPPGQAGHTERDLLERKRAAARRCADQTMGPSKTPV